ncbi:MAG TPA: hypothetical protein VJ866_00095 [Pyrinomonadaceae bacterium]|nr:hypothetical protein [Pyrinomonadaceae bacterium]
MENKLQVVINVFEALLVGFGVSAPFWNVFICLLSLYAGLPVVVELLTRLNHLHG